jgi:LemA protein
VLAIVGIGLYLAGSYNQMVQSAREIDRTFGNVEVSLKQRHDEIPRLVEVCRGYMKHEKTVLEELTRARSRFEASKNVDAKVETENGLSRELVRILALAEAYPDLKADDVFHRLEDRLTVLEDEIADRRELFNASVTAYNSFIQRFPIVVLAPAFRFRPRPLLELAVAGSTPPSPFGS